jgi:leucyl-tRNA synthetase
LKDLGLTKLDEPAMKLFNQGMLSGSGGEKMSKSKGNVILPETISKKYGIDAARFFLFSISSPEKDRAWSEKGIEGSLRVVNKIFPLIKKEFIKKSTEELDNIQNKTIKNVTETIENLQYNLSTIYLTNYINFLSKNEITKESIEILAKLISPFIPHIAEELWEKLGNKKFVAQENWPKFDKSKINPEIDAKQELIDNTIFDIKRIIDLLKIEPKKAIIAVAEEWKYELIKNLKEKLKETRDAGKLIKELMIPEYGKEISKIVPSLVNNESKIPKIPLSQKQEIETLKKNKELLEKELKIQIEIKKEDKKAMPSKPSIRIE